MSEPRTLAVFGFGYCGRAAAEAWRARGPVVAVGRRLDALPRGVTGVEVDLTAVASPSLPPVDAALVTIGTRGNEGAAARAARLACASGARRVVYLSSTSVYGDRGGRVVDADTPTDPDTPMGRARVSAEREFLDACGAADAAGMVLRLPGIYGPGRTIRDRVAAGEYRIPAEPEVAGRWSNRIHRDDVASAVLTLLDRGSAGEAYLASDGTPFRADALIRWVAEQVGVPTPPSVPLAEFGPFARQLWAGSRRCDATKLRALGWTPAYDDVFAGHLASWTDERAERRAAEPA